MEKRGRAIRKEDERCAARALCVTCAIRANAIRAIRAKRQTLACGGEMFRPALDVVFQSLDLRLARGAHA